MTKRSVALALAAIAAPMIVAAGAAPAAAAGVCDGVYPPGQAYGLRRSPVYAQVNKGARLSLSTRLVRADKECNGERVGFYTRGRGAKSFHLSRTADVNGRGLATQTYTVSDDFRWFTDFSVAGARLAQSAPALVQLRR